MIQVVPGHVGGMIHVVPDQLICVKGMIHVVPEQLICVVPEQIINQTNDSSCSGACERKDSICSGTIDLFCSGADQISKE
jgi:hypothetical protein